MVSSASQEVLERLRWNTSLEMMWQLFVCGRSLLNREAAGAEGRSEGDSVVLGPISVLLGE